jgi:hypothetical protein
MTNTTVNPAYVAAQSAIKHMSAHLLSSVVGDLTAPIIAFEDAMNGLSGALLGLEPSLLTQIRIQCSAIDSALSDLGYDLKLWSGLLVPSQQNVSHGTSVTQQAKKLYPLTTTVTTLIPASTSASGNVVAPVVVDANTVATLADDLPEEIDEIFAENEQDVVADEPLATLQNETTPYLSNSMLAIAQAAAEYPELQDGLVEFSSNPLAGLIGDTKDLFLYYAQGNYANLNTALSVIYADSNLTAQYKTLRESIGGPDGLAGCVSQMDFLLEHTNRLSGLVLDVNSPNDVTDNDSTDEYLNVNDVAAGVATVIFSFDSRYFRSAKYMVQATAASLDRGHQTTELVILHDNHHAYTREIVSVYSQDPFINFSTRLLNNRVEVLANTSASNTDFVIHGVRLRIARASKTYGEMSQTRIIEGHELLQTYLDDGVDYVASQSQSLLRSDLVASLAQLFRDMLVTFSNAGFLTQGTLAKQTEMVAMAGRISAARQAIQDRIDADYDEFVRVRKLAEALDIAYNLTASYTDDTGNAIPELTLNSATKTAILEDTE